MNSTRRMTILGLAACTVLPAGNAQTREWPTQPVKLVLPYPPGGASDVTARLLGVKLSQSLDTPVVIENRPGGNGIVANEAVAKALPDGYTILMANLGPNSINHAIYPRLPYDTLRDFSPIILTTFVPLVIVTGQDSPIKSLQQFIAQAKARPESGTYGSAGNGASSHVAGELLATMTGTRLVHVPYKGDAPALTDLMGGQIAVALPTALAALPHIRGGKLRPLAVTAETRIASLPDVPTVDEALGIKGYAAVSWGGFMAPAGTPPKVVARLNSDINEALTAPDVRVKLEEQGAVVVGGSSQKFDRFVRAELVKWKKLAEAAKLKVD